MTVDNKQEIGIKLYKIWDVFTPEERKECKVPNIRKY